ncbi:HNH endonuclease signature motif containing protein [Arthrobacter sp. MP_M7]|uniref:HNH endonuclease signature motif containing protein n=1 Tax=Arthrobacter sp. MP_M7 TaxID=3071716 RepID=UPI002E020187|nr:hypothetical protein [Arthrobacter sp. MP_M7]
MSGECVEAVGAVAGSVAALAAIFGAGLSGGGPGSAEPGGAGRDSASANGVGGDPLRDVADACLEGLAEVARLEAGAAAVKVRLTGEYVRAAEALAPPAVSPQQRTAWEMAVVAEVACVLTVSERAAGALICESRALCSGLPLTLAALQAGELSWQHARVMVGETTGLDRGGTAGLEAHFLDPAAPNPARGCPAGDLVPGRFRAKARTWRERHHPVSIEARHATCVADRRVEFSPDRDGMAWFSAYLPAVTASAAWDRATTAARALQGPAETRTLTQLRADITATWLLAGTTTGDAGDPGAAGGPGAGTGGAGAAGTWGVPSPRAQVLITVPVLSLLGLTGEPAVLDGYGPVPPSVARRLVADGSGSFYRVLTDPRDGAPLEIGRTSYRLTGAQRRWLRLRDGKCPFPGCNNASLDNEADHVLAWADGGTTGITNLGQPCRKHHRLKHASAWTPTGASKDHPPGWTSPMGRRYPSESQNWEPPPWPAILTALTPPPDRGSPAAQTPDPQTNPGPPLDKGQGRTPPPDEEHDTDSDWDLPPGDDPGRTPPPGDGPGRTPPPGDGPGWNPPPDADLDWDLDAELHTGLPPDPGPDPDQEHPADPLSAKYQPAA